MKKLIFAVVALLFAACTTEQTADIMPSAPKVLRASFDDDSRIQLNEEQKTVWTKNDLVSVFYNSDANQQWKFEGETGATTATLVNVTDPVPTKELSKVVAVYPYNEGYAISEDCKVTATLPTEQNYLADSYGLNGNIMVSYGEGDILKMRSILGWLKLQLTGDGEIVKSITLTGNDSEQIAGGVVIDPSDLSLELNDPTSTTLTLNCDEGVTLSEDVTTFYIGIPPQTFEEGFTAKIYCLDDKVMTKSTTNSVEIKRNTIKPMDELTYQADVPHNQIWYTSTDGNIVTPYKTDVFGADIVSNIYENGQGIITFDAPVTSIGEGAFEYCINFSSIIIPNNVSQIGNRAFYMCYALKNVNIPNGVTSIGYSAFYGCDSLTTITIPDSVVKIGSGAFQDCKGLMSVNIPNSVTSIGNYVFSGCSKLAEITGKFASEDKRCLIVDGVLNSFAPAGLTEYTIPDSVIKIGDDVFYFCENLTSITIPNSVTEIGNNVFALCHSLTSITIPDSITNIGSAVFDYCESLKSVYCKSIVPPRLSGMKHFSNNAPDRKIYVPAASVEDYKTAWSLYADVIVAEELKPANNEIWYTATAKVEPDSNAFNVTIKSNEWDETTGNGIITFDGDVTSIGNYAFRSCSSLTSITIPDSVTSIGDWVFCFCDRLKSVIIPNSVTSIGEAAFCDCSRLESVTIPNSVTSIGEAAFFDCSSLTSVTIPDSVTSLGSNPFYKCSKLAEFNGKFVSADKRCLIVDGVLNSFAIGCGYTEYTIPSGVISIGDSAFSGCSSLTSITIPDNVTSIGVSAFSSCRRLASVYCKPTTPPTSNDKMFAYNANGRKIYVPASDDDSIINAYKAKGYWSDYAADIEEYEFE